MSDFKKVLLIICDQFRFPQHWGTQEKDGKSFTPSIDKLRKNGVEFLNTYIASSACNASRACIYTGKYGQETGVTSTSGFGNETANPENPEKFTDSIDWFGYHPHDPKCSLPHDTVIKTLGTHFREAGYRAIYKGKWHLSEVEGGWPDKAYDAAGLKCFGFEGWNPPEGHGNSALRWGMGADTSYVQDVANTLFELKDTNHNWFMAANLINPHDVGFFKDWPLTIPDMGVTAPDNAEDDLANKAAVQKLGKLYWNWVTFGGEAGREPTSNEWADYVNFYAYLAQIADFNIGVILQALELSGQEDETLVVFLSDHGEMGGSHGMTQKWYQSYEETIHVPLIFSNPKFVGRQEECMASLIDVAPTLLSQAGVNLREIPEKDAFRGRDLSPLLHRNPQIRERFEQDAVLYVTDDDIVGAFFEDIDIPEGAIKGPLNPDSDKDYMELLKKLVGGKKALSFPRHIRTVRTQDGWNLTQYTHTRVAGENGDHPGDEYEMYDLNASKDQMDNLATPENLEDPDNRKKFVELKRKLFSLLEEKYFHPSMRPPEEAEETEETEE